jgi:hypothetical protein
VNVLLIGFENPNPNELNSMAALNTLIGGDNQLVQKLQAQPSWAKVMSNLYLVTTTMSAQQMRDQLLAVSSKNKVLVYNVTNSLWATNALTSEVNQWLQTNWRQT